MYGNFKDYYQILQVHHDASPDVIKSAYRRLSFLYHPDVCGNEKQTRRMMEINEAYGILGNPDKRTEYQRVWLEQHGQRSSHVISAIHPPQGMAYDSAQNILDQFFHALYIKNWDNAYACLTLEDQERISRNQFQAWREAVSDCFELQDYRIQMYRSYDRCRIGEVVYEKVNEYAVMVSDLDLQTSQVSQTTTHKYAAFDGTSWKVCLGIKSVKQAIMKFKLMAERRKNFDPLSLYESAVSKTDPLTGLLSEQGFYEEALKEVARHKRHHNPLSLIAFQVHCKNREREIPCLCRCASVIKSSCRITDIVGKFSDNQIICLLTETTESQALDAAQKFVKNIKLRQTEPFSLNASIIQYHANIAIEDAVFAACSDASREGNTLWISEQGNI